MCNRETIHVPVTTDVSPFSVTDRATPTACVTQFVPLIYYSSAKRVAAVKCMHGQKEQRRPVQVQTWEFKSGPQRLHCDLKGERQRLNEPRKK